MNIYKATDHQFFCQLYWHLTKKINQTFPLLGTQILSESSMQEKETKLGL